MFISSFFRVGLKASITIFTPSAIPPLPYNVLVKFNISDFVSLTSNCNLPVDGDLITAKLMFIFIFSIATVRKPVS